MVGPAKLEIWERRFLAPTVVPPSWSRNAPDRAVVVSDESGSFQAYAWDLTTGEQRRVTDSKVGLQIQEMVDATPTADGAGVVWFDDPTGDESGRWMVTPFAGGDPHPLLPDVPVGWPSGLAVGRSAVVSCMGYEDGFVVYVSLDGGPAREVFRHREEIRVAAPQWGGFNVAGLSRDESLACLLHAERGSQLHLALRVFDVRTGEVVGEQWDGEDLDLGASAWSPVPGDQRLAIRHELSGWTRPAIWDLETGERRDLALDLHGGIEVLDWWPDASAVLISQFHDARYRLWRHQLATGETTRIAHPDGCVWGAQVRPDGDVWMSWDSSSRSSCVLSSSGDEVLVPHGDPLAVTQAREVRDFEFVNPKGQRVHGFVVTPNGDRPHPTVMEVHGGPDWLWGDYWSPRVQALVDAGFAVALINYRGSAGYGREWRDALIGNVGFPETEDVVAAADRLVADGVSDPAQMVLGGRSWGGYLTLLGIGLHPDRWVAAVAGVPVGDYAAAYEDSAPSLQAMDRAYLGAPPSEIPEFVAERSPITYVDRVRCPVFVFYGENDSRCPPRQVENYIEALREAGGDVEVYKYGTGHSSNVISEESEHMRLVLDFLARRVPN